MSRQDDGFDAWLQGVNDGIVEALDSTTDVEAGLLRLKQNAAKEAVAVAHNRDSDSLTAPSGRR